MVYYIRRCIKYWTKLLPGIYGKRQILLTVLSYVIYRLDQAGRITWVSGVKDILFKYGVGFVRLSQEIGNADLFLQQFMQRLKDSALQQWNIDITQNSKLSSYREYKTMLNVEKYITDLKQWKLRNALARFRTSCHDLNIEVGRYINADRAVRYCKFVYRIMPLVSKMNFVSYLYVLDIMPIQIEVYSKNTKYTGKYLTLII